jgi:excisionase family DNA binding protein
LIRKGTLIMTPLPKTVGSISSGILLLTPGEVAQITGLSVETLAQWRSQRRGIPFVKVSRNCVRYRQSDLDRWLEERIVSVGVGTTMERRQS